MNKYKILAICGKSAAGKDTFLHKVIEQNPEVHEVVSCTTRPPREGEIHGKNYFFLSVPEFKNKTNNGEMLETSEFRDWYYGTSYEGLNASLVNVGVFNPEGILSLVNNPKVEVFVVIAQASDKTRLLRSLSREKNPDVDEIVRRYQTDKKDFEFFSTVYEPDYILDTEGISCADFETAAQEVVLLARQHWANSIN